MAAIVEVITLVFPEPQWRGHRPPSDLLCLGHPATLSLSHYSSSACAARAAVGTVAAVTSGDHMVLRDQPWTRLSQGYRLVP